MKALIKTKLSPHMYKTPEGYLICQDAIIGRTGVQEYLKSELFPDLKDTPEGNEVIKLYRMPEDVFADATMASFEHKPVTVEHPSEDVTPVNYKQYSVGNVVDVRKGEENGEPVMMANLFITDQRTIEDIENHIRTDLSCGYDCDITDDENPRQINIRGNHVALCEEGRAGNARIIDSAANIKDAIEDTKYIARGSNGNFFFVDSTNDVFDDLGTSDEFEAVSVVYEKYGYGRDEISTHMKLQDANKGGLFKGIKTLFGEGMSKDEIKERLARVLLEDIQDEKDELLNKSMGRQNRYDLGQSINRIGLDKTVDEQVEKALYQPAVEKDEVVNEEFVSQENKITPELLTELDEYLTNNGVYESIIDNVDFGTNLHIEDIKLFNDPKALERGIKFEFVLEDPDGILSRDTEGNDNGRKVDYVNYHIFKKLSPQIQKTFDNVCVELAKAIDSYFMNKYGFRMVKNFDYTTLGGDNRLAKKIEGLSSTEVKMNVEFILANDREISMKKRILKERQVIDDSIRIRIAPQKTPNQIDKPKTDQELFEDLVDSLYDKRIHKLFKKYGVDNGKE